MTEMDMKEKLVEIVCGAMEVDGCIGHCNHPPCFAVERVVTALIANGVTVQECRHKAGSVISKTGLMCTACYSDIDRDAVFCKYCGAKVMPQPPKGE